MTCLGIMCEDGVRRYPHGPLTRQMQECFDALGRCVVKFNGADKVSAARRAQPNALHQALRLDEQIAAMDPSLRSLLTRGGRGAELDRPMHTTALDRAVFAGPRGPGPMVHSSPLLPTFVLPDAVHGPLSRHQACLAGTLHINDQEALARG